ncbi:BsuBI/PstI family type II restriction endonuclease [Candidatus Ruminimicrobiellum ovillum]|uniref:BsuBI/PstI family type II restriction endonuclease n=1 Tax=Candidatus Ruminimicrobiellum ovillum TaxID=1947927 RepID=UPI003559F412
MKINLTGNKKLKLKKIIFETLDILVAVGIPLDDLSDRRKERMVLALLAVGNIKTSFNEVLSTKDNRFLKTRDIIEYENENFSEKISSGSYDDIRRKDLIRLVVAGIVYNSSSIEAKATNNPTRGYGLNPLFADLLKSYNTQIWDKELSKFLLENKSLKEEIEHKRNLQKIPVTLPSGENIELSYGEHNILQKEIIEKFLSKFGFNSQVVYVGDTSDKFLYKNEKMLSDLNCFELKHDELPDVIAYSKDRNLLFLCEAVHSTGPMSELRVHKLKKLLKNCSAEIIFLTAFLTKKDFRKWALDIAWETEVWIAETPEHMIHFNGYKFLEIH